MFELLTREKEKKIIKLNLENAVNYLVKEQNYNLCAKTAISGEGEEQYCIYYTKNNDIIFAERKNNNIYPVSYFNYADKIEFVINKIDGHDKRYMEDDVKEVNNMLLSMKEFISTKNVNYTTIANLINRNKNHWS